jgi:twitching motility protein PilT
MPLPLFRSDAKEALKKLASGGYASSEERDQLLKTVTESEGLKARDVVWMLFRPDRALREAALEILRPIADAALLDIFLAESRRQPDAALRAASPALLELAIPGLAGRLRELLQSEDEEIRATVRKLALAAPPSPDLDPVLWALARAGSHEARLGAIDRLADREPTEQALQHWLQLAREEDREIRERALVVLADHAAEEAVDLIVEELPKASYATQQHLVAALAHTARGRGPDFADRLLPLMAAGDAATRTAVLKILVGMENRAEIVRRYLGFSKGLAGWARDRALESIKQFGGDLIEPTIELLTHPDPDIRSAALVVAGSFDDLRIVPATIGLLEDPDWWLRITAAETLGRLRDPRAVEPLLKVLTDPEARWAAVEALGKIGDPHALPAMAQLLKDPSPEVRIEVLLAFKEFQHPKIMTALLQVAETDPDRIVRARALEIAEHVALRDETEIANANVLREKALTATVAQDEPQLHSLLAATRNQGASDLHLSVSEPPVIRIAGELVSVRGEPFAAEQTERMLREILTDEQWQRLDREQQLDMCYYVPKAGRYRANVFLDQRGYNAAFRVIPEKPPTITEVGLPPHLSEIASYHQGLVLICGPAGSGKSTTLAALVNLFNETRHDHIITLEDPVEFVHPFKSCLVNQREVGTHSESYSRALRAALREDPDVIVIGDLRDNESVSLALTAAETGHIVLATMNATTADRAVERLLSSFPAAEQPQVRAALSESLRFVIAQRLLPAVTSGRLVAGFEILKGTLPVANMIRDRKTSQLRSVLQTGRESGMQTFDEALKVLLRKELIGAETAYMAASSKKDFEALVPDEFLEEGTFL